MSEASGSRKALAGWTMVDSKGEAMTDDSRSESSDSSTDSLSLLQDPIVVTASSAASVQLSSEQNEELEYCGASSFPSLPANDERSDEIPIPKNIDDMTSSVSTNQQSEQSLQCNSESDGIQCMDDARQQSFDETALDTGHSTAISLVERDGGVGACCKQLLDITGTKNQCDGSDEGSEMEDRGEGDNCLLPSIPLDANEISSPSFLDEGNRAPRQRNNSDSDSDFVQINEENLEEFEAELSRSRNGIPNRIPSIAEGFNFLGPAGDRVDNDLPRNLSDPDFEEFNEDTESSTEDIGDDRIESDQSEVGSVMNILTDVGDLSAFADIGDLPLEAGNVARNYRHRPNNRLSTALNVILILISILTMGISIGLIMATDLEIEEWQNAYHMQVKKVSSLEWTLGDLNRVMQESKDKVNAYESVLKSYSKANDGSSNFFINFAKTVNDFESCTRKHGSLSTVDCHALILPGIRYSLFQFKEAIQIDSVDPNHFNFERKMEDEAKILPKEEQTYNFDHYQKMQELQQSLHREQERALHWQNLYLLERRQREWERENEYLEDQRERAQWEKEDEEEDRREREKWEREEEENDRKERLLWEREDQEEDKRERERWENERAEVDNLECLKKLMSTNLTFLRQHVMNWNVSAFDDFVNMSLLMSGIAEMKQSVLTSVQQIWVEAEEALNKMGEDVKNGKQPYLDTSVMADYLKQALTIVRSQFDDVVNEHTDNLREKDKTNSKQFDHRNGNKKGTTVQKDVAGDSKNEKESSMWNKTIGKVFKKTSKSLRKFVRTVGSSWSKISALWETRVLSLVKTNRKTEEVYIEEFLPVWLPGKACQSLWLSKVDNKQDIVVEVGSPCLWEVRDGLINILLRESCDNQNRYSRACNMEANTVWQLKSDLKRILNIDASFRANKILSIDGRNMLRLYEEFWKKWGNSELLLKSDKDWASCQLKDWSNAVYSNVRWTRATGRKCDRLVNLKKVLMEVDNREMNNDQLNTQIKEDAVHEGHEYETADEGNYLDEGAQENFEYYSSSQVDAETVNSGIGDENDDADLEGNSHQDSLPLKKNPPDIKHESNISDLDQSTSGSDNYKQTAWYLKRAQYRLEMRRAQGKASWFFDISDNRDEIRKEHNFEKKSGQWIFDMAEDRETQRKKDQEADWLFERARHRRDESSREWSHQPRKYKKRKVDAATRQKKMKKISESDWLLQNNGCNGKGGKKGKKIKCAFQKMHKRNYKFKRNEGKHKKRQYKKGKQTQQKNKKRFQNKSPKK